MNDKKVVIIIGAGPAGLTAAYEILKNDSSYKVIIYEESEYIGGISRTINNNGNRINICIDYIYIYNNSKYKKLQPMQQFYIAA